MNRLIKAFLLIAVLLIAALAINGCGKGPEVIGSEFSALISTEQKVTPESMAAAAEYMDQYLHKLSEEAASQMLVSYEAYMVQYINTDGDQNQIQSLQSYYSEKDGTLNRDKMRKDEATNGFYENLETAYVRVALKTGRIALEPDYARLKKEFGKDVLPAVSQLYDIKATISERPATDNATLQISYQELLSRAALVEGLIAENKDNKLIADDAKWLYSSYLNMIFMGTTNSPVFNYETGEFSAAAKETYTGFVKENPESSLTWAMEQYFSYLDSIAYKIDFKDSVMSKAFFDNCSRIVSETEKRVYQ